MAEPHVSPHDDEVKAEAAEGRPRLETVVWYREPHLRKLYFLCLFLLIGSATTGFDGMLQNTSQQMDAWKAFFPEYVDANKLGILINMYNVGSITSFFASSYMADVLGRKPTIMVGCVIMIAGSCVTALSNGYGMYLGGRFVIGFGNSLVQVCSPMLLTELCHPQHRGPLTTVYNCLWNLGSLMVSVVGWGTASVDNDWSWRSITLLQAVPSLVQLIGVWGVPESPRFLVNKGRSREALAVLAKYHGGGDANKPTVRYEFREIKQTIEMERKINKTSSYLEFFKTKGNRWRLAIVVSLGIISQYSGNALFSNYIDIVYEGAGIRDQNKKLALTAGRTIMDLCVSIASALCVDKVGRRPLFLVAISGMVVAFACWTVVGAVYESSAVRDPGGSVSYTNAAAGFAQIAFVWLFLIFYDIGFSGLLVAYALEILPFHLRAKGMVILNIVVQAVLAIGNQTNKLAWNNLPRHWNFMLFYTLWNFCELIFVYFFYVETKGPTLEEIARIFDGQDAVPRVNLEQTEKEARLASNHDQSSISDTKAV
ncbi:hypothetical protein GQ602_001338 [Ophiocordyceps camponoti-floridani]|uniref:Major facilitator superfamily (MFS) profile domain-containing protein n=1 Tax=Ophiocordyceps camponoti-floridani TaxID=2030778 RepID=A0A8H4VHE1_9HYPO|nr:hypothetical protein GQ602_001338 [Ophiocordyceps camponoti-floridani]